jgi:hypothetical protein
MNPKPKPRTVDLSKCATRVWGKQEGTARWNGYRQCGSPIAFRRLRADGSVVACYCTRHNPAGVAGVVAEPIK